MSTITREFTKEQLIEKLQHRIAVAAKYPDLEEAQLDAAIFKIALSSLEAEPVAWDYEWAFCITCEGPQNFKRIIEREAPPEWAINEGQARNLIPLYAAPPAPVAVPECFKRLLHHAYGMTMGHDWNKGTMAGHHRTKLCQVVEECRAAMLHDADGTLTNEGTKRVGELVMLVKRLAHSLRKANPDSKLQSDAMDYLSRKGLIGVEDILR